MKVKVLGILVMLAMVFAMSGCAVGRVGSSEDLPDKVTNPQPEVVKEEQDSQSAEVSDDVDENMDDDSSQEEDESLDEPAKEIAFQTCKQKWTTYDGYKLETTYAFSPWIRDSDDATVQAAWKQTGIQADFPDFSDNRPQYNYKIGPDGFYDMAYVIGYIDIRNKTRGFDIDAGSNVDVEICLGAKSEESISPLLGIIDNSGEMTKYIGSPKDATGKERIFENYNSRPKFRLKGNDTRICFVVAVGIRQATPKEPDGAPNPAGTIFDIYNYTDLQSCDHVTPEISWE